MKIGIKTALALILNILMSSGTVRGYYHAPSNSAILEQTLKAVNNHSPRDAVRYADPGEKVSFRWAEARVTPHWQEDKLSVPGTSIKFAVFHAWHTCQSDGDHVYPLISSSSGLRFEKEIPEDNPGGFRIVNNSLNVAFAPASHEAFITDLALVQRYVKAIPKFCLARISQDYQVTEMKVDNHDISFQQAGGVLAFAPPNLKSFFLFLRYSGVVNHTGSDYILPTEATLDSYWYPTISRLPSTASITVTAPPGWTALAQGELQKRVQNPDGSITYTYRNSVPVTYFTVDAAPYFIFSRKLGGVKLSAYLLENNQSYANELLDTLESAMKLYNVDFAPFPYTHYAVVQSFGKFEGALEAYSFATFDSEDMLDLIPHELSHTWWGGLLPCTYLHSMWDEAFADYSSGLVARTLNGILPITAPQHPHISYGRRFNAYPVIDVKDTSDKVQSDIGYTKGSLILRVLEYELGQKIMFQCLHSFIADHKEGVPVEWSDFEKTVNRITGLDYRWFFHQWLYERGLPSIQLQNVKVEKSASSYMLTGDIIQNGAPYQLTVPILIQTQNRNYITKNLKVTGGSFSFQISSSEEPVHLWVDPENILPLTSSKELDWHSTREPDR